MTFEQAVRTVLRQKYAQFSGRAQQSEFWWFALFQFLVALVCNIIGVVLFHGNTFLAAIAGLALIIPGLAVGVRRLHDVNKTGWLMLVALVPLIGGIVLLVMLIPKGTPGPNSYGPDPLIGDSAAVVV